MGDKSIASGSQFSSALSHCLYPNMPFPRSGSGIFVSFVSSVVKIPFLPSSAPLRLP